MYIIAALVVGADIEDLGEPELVRAVHLEEAVDEDEQGAGEGAVLDVEVHVGVLHGIEAQRLDLVRDLLEAGVLGPRVGHRAQLAVEVYQLHALVAGQAHGLVVVLEEDAC